MPVYAYQTPFGWRGYSQDASGAQTPIDPGANWEHLISLPDTIVIPWSWGGTTTNVQTAVPQIVEQPVYAYQPDTAYTFYDGAASFTTISAITGIQNLINKYGSLPRGYGTYRMRPPLAAQFVSIAQGSETYAMGLFCLGYGPLQIDDPGNDIKLGDKAISTIPNCTYEFLPGANPDSETITIFNPDFTDLNVNQALSYNAAANRTAPQSGVQLQIDIQFPNGLVQYDSSGNPSATTVQIKVERSTDGTTWTNVPPENGLSSDPCFTYSDNKTTAFSISRVVTVPKATYQVRVTRLTADSTDSNLVNATTWSLLRAYGDTPSVNPIKDRNGNKIGMAYIALKMKASDMANGQLEDLNVLVKSKLNTWTGAAWTTSPTATNNPAWIYADILAGKANKRAKSLSELDGNQLKAWADFCDTNGFTFNYVFDGGSTVNEALKQVAAAGRASIFQNDGKFSVLIDQKQTTAVQHFTPRNMHSLQIDGNSPEVPHALKMQFANADDNKYVQDERIVYWDGYNSDGSNGLTAATLFQSIPLVGVTNKDQAWKLGRYTLAIANLRRRKVSFVTDIEHLRCNRFDMVRVRDDVAGFGLGQGIIKTVTTDGSGNVTSITLDETVSMTSGKSYGIWVRMSDMSEAHYAINTAPGTTPTLTFTTPIPAATSPKPVVGNMVMFGEYGSEAQEMIVFSIENQDEKSARITCIDHAPAVYDAANGTIPDFTSGVTSVPVQQQTVDPPTIISYRTDEKVLLKDTDGSLQSRIQVTLAPPASTVQYFEAQIKLSDATLWGSSQVFPASTGEIYLSPVLDGKSYDIQIRCISFSSRLSAWTQFDDIMVVGKSTPPPDIPTINRLGTNTNVLVWSYDESTLGEAVPADFAGFRIKWCIGANPNWDMGTVAADLIVNTQFDMTPLPKGALTIMVKAVDTAGNESENAAILLKDFGDEETSNVISTTNHHTTWTRGTITNGTVVAGALKATDNGGIFYSDDGTAKFYNGNPNSLMYSQSYNELMYAWTTLVGPEWCPTGAQPPELIIDIDQDAENFTLLYRNGGNSLFYDTSVGAENYPFYDTDGSSLFYDALPPFVPFPGRVRVDNPDTFQFKAIGSASASIQAIINTLSEILDVPDVEEYIDDASISSGGTRLSLQKIYRAITNLQLTWQQDAADAGSRPYIPTYTDKSVSGPLVKLYDRTGAAVAGKVDARVQGY